MNVIKALVLALFLGSPALAESKRDEVYKVLKQKLNDKTFEFAKVTEDMESDGSRSTSDLKRRWTFGNFKLSKIGLSFDAVININQTNTYHKEGVKSVTRKRDRYIVVKYEFRDVGSSTEMLGFSRYDTYIGAEDPDPIASAQKASLRLVGDQLVIVMDDITPAPIKKGIEGETVLISCRDVDTIDLAPSKPKRKFVEQCYDVDSKTFERGDKHEPYEIEETIID